MHKVDILHGWGANPILQARPRQMTRTTTAATATALAATLGLAAAFWVVALKQMNGMDMGVATQLGSFAFFVALWVSMMAAMILPGAVAAVSRRTPPHGRVGVVRWCVRPDLAVRT